MHRALPFMAEAILACMSHQYVSHRVFSHMSSYPIASLLHWVLVTTTSPPENLSWQTYAFPLNLIPPHDELTGLLIGFLLVGPHLDSLSPGCKHCGQPLWSGDGICSESWLRGQQQLVRCLPGRGAGHRRGVKGIQRYIAQFYNVQQHGVQRHLLVLLRCDPLCQCQQRYCRPPLRSPLYR